MTIPSCRGSVGSVELHRLSGAPDIAPFDLKKGKKGHVLKSRETLYFTIIQYWTKAVVRKLRWSQLRRCYFLFMFSLVRGSLDPSRAVLGARLRVCRASAAVVCGINSLNTDGAACLYTRQLRSSAALQCSSPTSPLSSYVCHSVWLSVPGTCCFHGVSVHPCTCVSVFALPFSRVQNDGVDGFGFICGCTFPIRLVSLHFNFLSTFFILWDKKKRPQKELKCLHC